MSESARTLPGWINGRSVLIFSVLIAGLCSIVYELLISTTASYFLGDTVRQFSIVIGVYMAAMGVGSFLSRTLEQRLLVKFIAVEILLGVLGGISVPLLYAAFAYTDVFHALVIVLIFAIGVLTGFEVPLVARILERHYVLKENLSNVLSLDYLGALVATLAFPFVLLPFLGIFRSAVAFGMLNIAMGFLVLWVFADEIALSRRRVLYLAAGTTAILLVALLSFSQILLSSWSQSIYGDRIVYQEQTPHQNIVLTRYKDDVRLYLDGHLQFSSIDEYRYHEALIQIPLAQLPGTVSVLILGGGDGLAARELLKHDRVQSIRIVDLDPAMFRIARDNPHLRAISGDALLDPRVETITADGFVHVKDDERRRYRLVVADLPDPKNAGLARLYSREFYRIVSRHLTGDGIFVTQATSPFYASSAFWSVANTLEAGGFDHVMPYHVYVPSFGDWGFVAASQRPLRSSGLRFGVPLRFLTPGVAANLTEFAADLQVGRSAEVSTLDDPAVLSHYLAGWQYWR